MKKTVEDIREGYLERYGNDDGNYMFNNIMSEAGLYLSDYPEEDEFILYKDTYIPADEWMDYADYGDMLDFVFDNKMQNDFYERLGIDANLRRRRPINYSHKEINKELIDFIGEAADEFFEWLERKGE